MQSIVYGYAFALLTAIVVIAADTLLKVAAEAGHPVHHVHVLAGCVLYCVSALMWFGSMHHLGLAQAGIAYSMFTLLALAAIGAIWFGEPVGLREVGGIGCALLAMVLMVRFG